MHSSIPRQQDGAIAIRFPYSELFFCGEDPTVNSQENDFQALRALLRDLATRVERLERIIEPSGPSTEQMQGKQTQSSPLTLAPPPALLPEPVVSPARPSPSISTTVPIHTPAIAVPRPEANLESRIGSHWLNRIGISAVLVGVSYFLKFAFDNNWIGPAGRVSIGLLAGIAVVVWSETFRARGYKVFSYSLKAVGIGVLYLSLWAAFQVYGLISSGAAFVAMVIVTVSTATLALKQDAEILAALALAGGFATPLLLSTGQNREIQLFSYAALLDIASLVLIVVKPWRQILVLSYAGTLVLYLGWYAEYYGRDEFAVTFAFATIFFAIFALAPLLAKAPNQAHILWQLPVALTFINTGAYFLQAYVMFEEIDKLDMAWFALALAAVHIGLSRLVRRQQEAANAGLQRLLHLSLSVALITIAVPIRLDGHWITVGWLVEAGVLLWVADRIRVPFLHYLAAVALALGVARLLVVDNFVVSTALLNWRMATYFLAMAVLTLRDPDSRAQFDEKSRAEPRPGDASGKEGEELVLRDEGARGRGQQDQDHSHGGGDRSPCFRCGDVAGPAAWRRNAGVGRRSVSGANRGNPRVCAASAGFHATALSLQRPDRGPSGMGEEPDEIEGTGEGGARVSSDEAAVRIRESTLSRAEEERAPAVRHLCAGKSVCEPQKTARRGVGSCGFVPYARLQRRY